jgi:hypothetical protein
LLKKKWTKEVQIPKKDKKTVNQSDAPERNNPDISQGLNKTRTV